MESMKTTREEEMTDESPTPRDERHGLLRALAALPAAGVALLPSAH
jgi:hypothetical protein